MFSARKSLPVILIFVCSAVFSVSQNIDKVRVKWELVNGFSSHANSKDKDNTLTITPDDVITYRLLFKNGTKSENPSDNNFDKIYGFLSKNCKSIKKEPCKNYLGNSAASAKLAKLSRERYDIVVKILKLSGKWENVSISDKEIILQWFINYVGQWQPKIKITVDNILGETDIIVTDLIYDISKITINEVKLFSPAIPFGAYLLPPDTGIVKFPVKTVDGDFRNMIIRKGNYKSFEIILCPSDICPLSASWYGVAFIDTNIGKIKIGKLNITTFNPNIKKKSVYY